MFDIGGGELLLIVLAILLLFGPKKIPELAQMFGKGLAQFRKAQTEFQRNLNAVSDEIQQEAVAVQQHIEYVPPSGAVPTVHDTMVAHAESIESTTHSSINISNHDKRAETTHNVENNTPESSPLNEVPVQPIVIRPASTSVARS